MRIKCCSIYGCLIRDIVHRNGIDISLFPNQIVKSLHEQLTGSFNRWILGIYRHSPLFLLNSNNRQRDKNVGNTTKTAFCRLFAQRNPSNFYLRGCSKNTHLYDYDCTSKIVWQVTGANGKLGRKIVEELLKRVPAGDIGVSVRDVNKVQDLKERGVHVRQGNFDDSESLLHVITDHRSTKIKTP